jgi:hypothetical protein
MGQKAVRELDSYQINSKLFQKCHKSAMKLAKHNRVQLVWVFGHQGTNGNEITDGQARKRSECPFTVLEPACQEGRQGLGLINNPSCERWQNKEETASHVKYDIKGLDNSRFRHLGSHFMQPSNYLYTQTSKVLHFFSDLGLLQGK